MELLNQQKVILLKSFGSENFPEDYQNKYHTHIYCQRGKINFMFNNRSMEAQKGEFVFWLAESEIADLCFSKSFMATILFVEKDLLSNNFPNLNIGIDAIIHHKTNPILFADKKNKDRILKNFQLLYLKSLEIQNRFFDEVLKLQMQLFILEMWDIFIDQLERRNRSLQSGTLFERFTHLIEMHCMQNREVKFYSNQLNISPKYLNQICKTNTGISASQWIQRYAKDRIVLLLENKSLNISEISDQMGFSSHSFFTRYVKKVLGISPSEFRNRVN